MADFERVEMLDDEDLMASAFAYGAKTDDNDKSTKCMHSCTDTCCC